MSINLPDSKRGTMSQQNNVIQLHSPPSATEFFRSATDLDVIIEADHDGVYTLPSLSLQKGDRARVTIHKLDGYHDAATKAFLGKLASDDATVAYSATIAAEEDNEMLDKLVRERELGERFGLYLASVIGIGLLLAPLFISALPWAATIPGAFVFLSLSSFILIRRAARRQS